MSDDHSNAPTAAHEPAGEDYGHHRSGHGHADAEEHGNGVWDSIKHFFAPHSHDVSDSIDNALEDSRLGERVTKQTLVIKLAGSAMQLAIVAISGSLALMADMIHSFADASTTIPLWIAFVMGRRKATSRFTYGFRRAEDLVGVFIILVIMGTAAMVIWESYQRLITPEPIVHLPWVAAAAIVGILTNEYVARLRIRVGRKIGSSALLADGLHARTDTLSSGAVLIAVAGVALGYGIVDSLVGFVVAAIILWMMKDTALQIFRRLMDGVEPGIVDEIRSISDGVEGVEKVDSVRARWSGHRMLVELIISVDSRHSVAGGHGVAEDVRQEVIDRVGHVDDVLVHVHPAEGDDGHDSCELTRHQLWEAD